jgi:hypothetical protein
VVAPATEKRSVLSAGEPNHGAEIIALRTEGTAHCENGLTCRALLLSHASRSHHKQTPTRTQHTFSLLSPR